MNEKQNVPGRRFGQAHRTAWGGFNFGSLAVLLRRARNLRSMALRPRLSAGLLVSVSMLGRFDWRHVTTAVKAPVKRFVLTIVLDFPVKYHL